MKYFFFFKTTHHFQLKVNLKMLYMGREVSKKLGVSNMSVSGFCVCVCGKGETLYRLVRVPALVAGLVGLSV